MSIELELDNMIFCEECGKYVKAADATYIANGFYCEDCMKQKRNAARIWLSQDNYWGYWLDRMER